MYEFTHEKLDCYNVAREVNDWIDEQGFSKERENIEDQIQRASDSVLLNIAEGVASEGKTRRYHLRKARASAAECCACLDRVRIQQAADQQQKLRRVGAMLTKMIQK